MITQIVKQAAFIYNWHRLDPTMSYWVAMPCLWIQCKARETHLAKIITINYAVRFFDAIGRQILASDDLDLLKPGGWR